MEDSEGEKTRGKRKLMTDTETFRSKVKEHLLLHLLLMCDSGEVESCS